MPGAGQGRWAGCGPFRLLRRLSLHSFPKISLPMNSVLLPAQQSQVTCWWGPGLRDEGLARPHQRWPRVPARIKQHLRLGYAGACLRACVVTGRERKGRAGQAAQLDRR